ncbi:CdaR family transcriptional regulator [Limosilactobacillus sp.]|uniref:CdaR family transcriptional regulator n=1 Tax=Limosilactobacillus sp. TaxID=2773925 RepID=UPI003F054D41
MKLNAQLAQSIVDHMMNQIPYNINIMNEHGYIIASGNPNRINTLHVGAVDAIKQGKTLPMDRVHGSHGQPGVNMPITYEGQIVGVVGITGDPAKVVPLASLLKTAVELLLKQGAVDQEKRENERSRQRFLYHLLQATQNHEAPASLVAEAKELNIDLTIPRVVVAIRCRAAELEHLNNAPTNLTFTLANNIGLVIIQDDLARRRLLKSLNTKQFIYGTSEATTLVGRGAQQAVTTLKLRENFQDNTLTAYHQVRIIDLLLKSHLPIQSLVQQFNTLATSKTGKELIETIKEFIKYDLNVNQTAKQLFTHRNTVNYRLAKIKEIFHLDPKKATDLFQLYIGYAYFINQEDLDNNLFR